MEKESLIEYLRRKIAHTALDKSKLLFSQRVRANLIYRAILAPYRILVALRNILVGAYRGENAEYLRLIENAISDRNGLGMLDLRLHNAHVPKKYYEIFYKLPFIVESQKSVIGGGQQR